MSALAWLILIFALLIVIPLVLSLIRDRDFKRQADGKKPLRKWRRNQPYPMSSEKKDLYYEILKGQAELKARQNFFGPK